MDIENRVKQIIGTKKGITEEIKNDYNLTDNLSVDSLDKIEIIMSLEEAFNIDFPDELIDECTTIQSLIDVVTPLVD